MNQFPVCSEPYALRTFFVTDLQSLLNILCQTHGRYTHAKILSPRVKLNVFPQISRMADFRIRGKSRVIIVRLRLQCNNNFIGNRFTGLYHQALLLCRIGEIPDNQTLACFVNRLIHGS